MKRGTKAKAPARSARKFTPVDTPIFQSEEEEATWWDTHPEVVTALLETGIREGTLTHGAMLREIKKRPTRPTTIRLFTEDMDLAKSIAHRKGLPYQTYLKMVIHEAIQREQGAKLTG